MINRIIKKEVKKSEIKAGEHEISNVKILKFYIKRDKALCTTMYIKNSWSCKNPKV